MAGAEPPPHTTGSPAPEPPAIRVEGVSKDFHLVKQKPFLVHSLVRRIFGVPAKATVCHALTDVSFEVRRGEAVALIGRNGAGKSTLLSLIVGTVLPTRGTVRTNGSIGALLELGVGFHPHLTGRENVYLNASLHGLSNARIDTMYESIVEFSELGEFMDAPLATYSSGMYVRLGFAVAVHLDPDIIIVDEALAVGDQQFREKCLARVRGMIAAGKTLMFVSHTAGEALDLCSRALWLEHGRLMLDGEPGGVMESYVEFLRSGAAPPLFVS